MRWLKFDLERIRGMNTLYTQFKEALKREKHIITTYYTKEDYPVLFRKVEDVKSDSDYSLIFYESSTPLYQGQLITFKGENYIIISKESVENDVYYKSYILKCNIEFPVEVNLIPTLIPFYAYNVVNPGLKETSFMNLLQGDVEIITEATEAVKNISLDFATGLMGRWFKITNTYQLNGIAHIFLGVTQKPQDNFSLKVHTTRNDLDLDENITTAQITAVAMNNTTIITGQTITYESSDPNIVTVDNSGLVTAVGAGEATITITWIEKGITETIMYSVYSALSENYTLTLEADDDFIIGWIGSTVSPTLINGKGEVVEDWTAVWTIDYNGLNPSIFTITYEGNNIKIKITDNSYTSAGKVFYLTCTTSDNLATATMECEIII